MADYQVPVSADNIKARITLSGVDSCWGGGDLCQKELLSGPYLLQVASFLEVGETQAPHLTAGLRHGWRETLNFT